MRIMDRCWEWLQKKLSVQANVTITIKMQDSVPFDLQGCYRPADRTIFVNRQHKDAPTILAHELGHACSHLFQTRNWRLPPTLGRLKLVEMEAWDFASRIYPNINTALERHCASNCGDVPRYHWDICKGLYLPRNDGDSPISDDTIWWLEPGLVDTTKDLTIRGRRDTNGVHLEPGLMEALRNSDKPTRRR